MAKRKSNKALEFDEILKKIAEGELETVHYNGNSAAWKIFDKIRYVKDNTAYVDYVQCKTCGVLRTHTPENGTSTLKKHKCKNAKEDEVVYKNISPEESSEIKEKLLAKSLQLCATDMIPLDIVSGSGFLNFAQMLVGIGELHGNISLQGLLPKTKFLTRHINNLNEDEQQKLGKCAENALKRNHCSLSMDCHIKADGGSQLLASLIFFNDDLTQLTKKHIFTLSVEKDYCAEKIMCDIKSKLKTFGCDDKMLKKLSVVTPAKDIFVDILDGICLRVDCAAFIINSFLKPFSDCDEVSELFLRCKGIMNYLIETGKETKLKFKMTEDNDSWEHKILLIQKMNLNYNEVMDLLSVEKRAELKFDQKLAEELVEMFEVFIDAFDDLQSTNYPTSNKVLLWWSILNDHFNSKPKYSKPLKRATAQAKLLFETNFVPTIDQRISCFLDPRYRFLKMLSPEDRTEVIREVREILDNMPNEPCKAPAAETCIPPTKKSKFKHLEANDDDTEERDEINVYIHSTQLSSYNLADSEMNIVSKFWKSSESKLPKLSRLALSKLHVPACCCTRDIPINLKRVMEHKTINSLLLLRDTF